MRSFLSTKKQGMKMSEANSPDILFYLLIAVTAGFVFILVLYKLCLFFNQFSQRLRYLNNEIGRTYGAERKRWLAKRRKLWLSLIPFVKFWFVYLQCFSLLLVKWVTGCNLSAHFVSGKKCVFVFNILPHAVPSLKMRDGRQSKGISRLFMSFDYRR